MKKIIHHSRLHAILTPGAEVSIRYWSFKDGCEITLDKWVVTSFYSAGGTVNVMSTVSKQVRKLSRVLILEINNIEIYI